MKIRSLFMAGVLTMGVNSCKKAPYQEMSEKYIPQIVTERVDSIALESKKILKDSSYIKYANDTIELTKDFFNKPAKFVKRLNNSAESNIPQTSTGSYTTMIPVVSGKTTIMVPQVHNIYEDNFLNTKTVINSTKIFTRDNSNMFVPVEYYGIPNPKLKSI